MRTIKTVGYELASTLVTTAEFLATMPRDFMIALREGK